MERLAPVALALDHTDSVYVPFGRAETVCDNRPAPVSCHDQLPVRPSFELAPFVAVHPAGVVTDTRSASKVGLSSQLLPGATCQLPVLASMVHWLRDSRRGVVPANVSGIHWLYPSPLPAKSAQRSPAKMTVVAALPLTLKKKPV